MNNVPKDAQYYYQHTYYKLGEVYAYYYAKGTWRESASVTNDLLRESGTLIK